jgi:hypothetical protein
MLDRILFSGKFLEGFSERYLEIWYFVLYVIYVMYLKYVLNIL